MHQPWQSINDPTVEEVARTWANPPPEYCLVVWWGWNGPITQDVIVKDLDRIQAMGARAFLIEAGYGMTHKYLSPGWFELISFAVEQARQRNMRVWLVDEGKYPSGFAGGKFSEERPDLRMQALVVADRITLPAGQTISKQLSPDCVGAIAVNLDDQSSQLLDTVSGRLSWTAPPQDNWEIRIVEHQFRTSPTRSANNPTGAKDTSASLLDYLNPAATEQFIQWTHEQYRKYIGQEFGRTVMGFMSDEPDYSYTPWTPDLPEQFQRRKGYDVRPWLAAFFAPQLSDEALRVRADYWDVWSDIFRETFFGRLARWCEANSLEYICHLNCEDRMPLLARSEGDFFKLMRHVHVPGIDAIWDQIWMGKVADFPKLASSAAHLFGRPRAFSESFAAYKPIPNIPQARWIINHQYVRGINLLLVMFFSSTAGTVETYPFFSDPQFPSLVTYVNRASYLLSLGRPTATIAVYHPTSSLWLGDEQADAAALDIARQLLEHQRDFDFIDEQALSSILKLDGPRLTNFSGQSYQAVIIPSATSISTAALNRLRTFAAGGGTVLFLGRKPTLAVSRSFRDATVPEDLSWAQYEPTTELSPRILEALPPPDVRLDRPCPAIKYLHRRWQDAELYFFFNESDQPCSATATLRGSGSAQLWDADSGQIFPMASEPAGDGFVRLTLQLEPQASKFIVLANTEPS